MITFDPLCREMHAKIARGELGRILSVSGFSTQDSLLLVEDTKWRVEPDGHREVQSCEAIAQSARAQEWVAIAP